MKWRKGRQGSGYDVLTLWNALKCDLHVIRVPAGVEVKTHVDPVPEKRHFRLNIHLGTYTGGWFEAKNTIISILDRVFLFRPNSPHRMEKVSSGTCYILSIGTAF